MQQPYSLRSREHTTSSITKTGQKGVFTIHIYDLHHRPHFQRNGRSVKKSTFQRFLGGSSNFYAVILGRSDLASRWWAASLQPWGSSWYPCVCLGEHPAWGGAKGRVCPLASPCRWAEGMTPFSVSLLALSLMEMFGKWKCLINILNVCTDRREIRLHSCGILSPRPSAIWTVFISKCLSIWTLFAILSC